MSLSSSRAASGHIVELVTRAPLLTHSPFPPALRVFDSSSNTRSGGTVTVIHNNSRARDLVRAMLCDIDSRGGDDGGLVLSFRGQYHNMLTLFNSVKRRLERELEGHPTETAAKLLDRKMFFSMTRRAGGDDTEGLRNSMLLGYGGDSIPSESSYHQTVDIRRSATARLPVTRLWQSSVEGCRVDGYTMGTLIARTESQWEKEQRRHTEAGQTFERLLVPINMFLNGIKTAEQWYLRGIDVRRSLRIHPEFSVYLPTRRDYTKLLSKAMRAEMRPGHSVRGLGVGTGTGVLEMLIARDLGVRYIVGTDINPWAIECAKNNWERLKLYALAKSGSGSGSGSVERHFTRECVFEPLLCDTYPPGGQTFDVIVCNPPWITTTSSDEKSKPAERWNFEESVQDRDALFLTKVIAGARDHLRDEHSRLFVIHSDLTPVDMDSLAGQHGLVMAKQYSVPSQTSREKYRVLCYVLRKA